MSRQILVIGPSWVGDMVMAQSVFMKLARDDPETAIDVVGPPGPLALAARMPEVRATFPLPVSHGRLGLGARLSLSRKLRAKRYDRSIVLPSSLKSALIPALAGIPVRTGYRGELRFGLINDMRSPAVSETEQNVRGYLALAEEPASGRTARKDDVGAARASQGSNSGDVEIPRPRLVVDPANQARLVAELALSPADSTVALAPGAAFGPAKRWPIEKYRALASELVRAGCAVWVLGGPEDRPMGEAICHGVAPDPVTASSGGGPLADRPGAGSPASRSGGRAQQGSIANLCGRTSLTDAVDLLNLAAVTVANDSGLMHVAAASGSHVIALYGPTPPEFAPPLTDKSDIFYLGIECSPCFARECPLGHHRCLEDIAVERVRETVVGALTGGVTGGGVDSEP